MVDVAKMTDTILAQRFIGSVIKQSISDTDSDDGIEDPNEVYAISTVLNLSDKSRWVQCCGAVIMLCCVETR